MVTLVLFFMISISGNVVQIGSENILKEVVHENIEEIEYKKNSLDFSDVDMFDDGVTSLVYSENGVLLYGNSKIEFTEPLKDGVITKATYNQADYLIYDKYFKDKDFDQGVYVRGIISVTSETKNINMLILVALLSLPIFIVISAIGSYLICKKSLKPLDKMIETTEMIIKENDLSVRINHNKGRDEVSRLAISFDKMLEKLDYTLEKEKQFTSDVSHELRTPVSVILAQCELDEESETTNLIKQQALKIRMIISQLLKLIRLENGIEKAEFEQVNLSELVQIICDEQKEIISTNIETNIDENVEMKLDYSMIMRILTNLISNSAKYIGDGDKIQVNLIRTDEKATVSIIDNGIGISTENIDKVFDRFFTVDKSRTDQESMGLGLSMVKQMVEINGGEITIDSEINKGTTVKLTFKGENYYENIS